MKFEYCTKGERFAFKGKSTPKKLEGIFARRMRWYNELGGLGWEIIQINNVEDAPLFGETGVYVFVILKRRIDA